MNFNVRTHESLMLLAGLLILVEQEAVRLLSSLFLTTPLEPSSVMSGAGVSLVIGSVGATAVRNLRENKRNGGDSE